MHKLWVSIYRVLSSGVHGLDQCPEEVLDDDPPDPKPTRETGTRGL
jgi:hypothetical protein